MTRQSAALSSGAAALHRKRGSTDRHRVGAHAAAFRGPSCGREPGGLWRAVREDRAGGSANDPFGHAAAQKQTNQAGPAARRENDQVAPEPPGNARNLIGRIAIYHQSVGCHPGLAK